MEHDCVSEGTGLAADPVWKLEPRYETAFACMENILTKKKKSPHGDQENLNLSHNGPGP